MKDKSDPRQTEQDGNKRTDIDADLDNYGSSRRFYILPPVDATDATDGDAEMNGANMNGIGGGEMIVCLDAPSAYDPDGRQHAADRFFITQVNVPSDRRGVGFETDAFSSRLVADSFSETVAVPVLPRSAAGPRLSCAAFCNYESERRFRESVLLEPAIAPSAFEVSMVCYQDCTKKKFRTTVYCCPRMRPRRYGTTNFVQPKRQESRFVSYVDYNDDRARQWHTSTVNVLPMTACNSFVRGFQFANRSGIAGGAEEESELIEELESVGSSGFLDDDCGHGPGQSDLDVHLDHSHSVPNGGYRAHMVVGGRGGK